MRRTLLRKVLFLPVALLLGGWLFLRMRLPPHPSLLEIASPTAFVGYEPYVWVSNQQLLHFPALDSLEAGHAWKLMLLDAQTGGETPLPMVTRWFPQLPESAAAARVSPDSKWLLTQTRNAICAIALDGSRTLQWPISYEANAGEAQLSWLRDSRRFVSCEQALRMTITVRSVDAPTTVQHIQANPSPEFFARDYFSSPRITENGLLYAYASAYEENDTRTLLTLPLFPQGAQRKAVLHAPAGMRFMSSSDIWGNRASVSPQGNRVAWLCRSHTFRSAWRVWLHRLFPGAQAPPQQWESLYVSRLEGGELREIGGVLADVVAADGQETLDERQALQDVRWLPDGKHISFRIHDKLYRVSAE